MQPETSAHRSPRYLNACVGLIAAAGVLLSPLAANPALAEEDQGGRADAVYTMTNATGADGGNSLLAFRRHHDGTLTPSGAVKTGGNGSGTGLGSGHSIVVSHDGGQIVVVNAGSNTISAFTVRDGDLTLSSTAASGGVTPTSVTQHDDLVYVMNAGSNSIAGFRLERGTLAPIVGSIQPLGAGTSVASQIQFDKSGDVLIVDERGGAGTIDTFVVSDQGLAVHAQTVASSGGAPFGFDVDRKDHILFSNAALGGGLLSGASSYDVSRHGVLTPNGGPVSSGQLAACWLAAAGHFAYTTNGGSGSIGRYGVGENGTLTLLGTYSIGTGSHPLDEAVSGNQKYLYVLADGLHEILGFRVGADGSLTQVTSTVIPVGAAGLGAH